VTVIGKAVFSVDCWGIIGVVVWLSVVINVGLKVILSKLIALNFVQKKIFELPHLMRLSTIHTHFFIDYQ
jgi:hypothetical protein